MNASNGWKDSIFLMIDENFRVNHDVDRVNYLDAWDLFFPLDIYLEIRMDKKKRLRDLVYHFEILDHSIHRYRYHQ